MIMQLRKAANHPYLFDWPVIPGTDQYQVNKNITHVSGKMLLLERLLPALFKDDHKVLIFSQFTTMLDIIEDWALQIHQWECCRIDGGVSQDNRQKQIKAFNTDKNVKLFLLSTRAGGLGINLTSADTVVIFDSDWNPQQDLQAQDRAHRIGQTKVCVLLVGVDG
jgi:ATP-dependent DNA helicase